MITTLVLEPGNVNVTELDLDGELNVIASRPIDRVFKNIRLAAMPKRGEFPQLIIVEGGRPLSMDRPVTHIRTKKRHKLTFGRKPCAKGARVFNPSPTDPAQRPSESDASTIDERACRMCGCTQDDCRVCIERTGEPCHWVEQDLCSACKERADLVGVDGSALPKPAPSAVPPAAEEKDERPRIKILTCSDAAAAAGFHAGDIVPVESFGPLFAFVKPRQGDSPHIIITNAESQPVPQEDAA